MVKTNSKPKGLLSLANFIPLKTSLNDIGSISLEDFCLGRKTNPINISAMMNEKLSNTNKYGMDTKLNIIPAPKGPIK